MPYLPPVPPMGTGFHRYVFSLYTHTQPLPLDHACIAMATSNGGGSEGKVDWLEERSFSSSQFLATHLVAPHTFCFFQAQWDKSVRHTYQHYLSKQHNTQRLQFLKNSNRMSRACLWSRESSQSSESPTESNTQRETSEVHSALRGFVNCTVFLLKQMLLPNFMLNVMI